MTWVLLFALLAAAAIRLRDHLEGEALLRDLWTEFRLARADLSELDRHCAANPRRSDIVVSLTTIPSRMPFIADTLKSLMRQTRAPQQIRLNLPRYSRREQAAYALPEWLTRLETVIVVPCEDFGPATKLIPSLQALPPDQMILAVDDDRIYPATLIEDLERGAAMLPDAALGLSGWIVPADLVDRPTTIYANLRERSPVPIRATRIRAPRPVDILQGLSGFLVRPRFFDIAAVADYSRAPPAAYFVDDVWFGAHCTAAKFVIPAHRSNFQPFRHAPFYRKTSLGRLNSGGGDNEKRSNTLMLKYFSAAWRVGGPPR
jgi:hypothetical protein